MKEIKLIKGDITDLATDAIVNAANNTLLGGGGVDGAIHRAGGPRILEQCKRIGGCPTGEARITVAGDLKAKYVIHTVGPVYRDGKNNEDKFLSLAYKNSIKLADEYGLKSIAFPFISTGAYSYPKDGASRIALNTVREAIEETSLEEVYFVLFSQEDFDIFKEIL